MKAVDILKETTTKNLIAVSCSTKVSNGQISHKVDDVLKALSEYLDTALDDYAASTAVSDLREEFIHIADEDEVQRILKITGTRTLFSAANHIEIFEDILQNTENMDEEELRTASIELDKIAMSGADIIEVLQRLVPILEDYSVSEVEEALCKVEKKLRGKSQ